MNTLGTTDSRTTDRRDIRRGALLIAVGLWLLVSTLDIPGLHFRGSWPLLIIFIGATMVLWPRGHWGRLSGITMIGWGAVMWIAVHDTWGLGWKDVWPLFLIVIGIELIGKAILDQRRSAGVERS